MLPIGLLAQLTGWLVSTLKVYWDAFVVFMGDFFVSGVEGVLSIFVMALNALPVPDFLTTYSLNSLLAQSGGTIMWLVGTFKIGECLGVIAAGWAFRLLRKLFTLGQW